MDVRFVVPGLLVHGSFRLIIKAVLSWASGISEDHLLVVAYKRLCPVEPFTLAIPNMPALLSPRPILATLPFAPPHMLDSGTQLKPSPVCALQETGFNGNFRT